MIKNFEQFSNKEVTNDNIDIENVNEEHHLEDTQDMRDYILEKLIDHPTLEDFIKNIGDNEVESIYRQVERWAGEY